MWSAPIGKIAHAWTKSLWASSVDLGMGECVHGWISFISLDEMNGCMIRFMDEMYSFVWNAMGIGIEIFTSISIWEFP
jgi:hypothetical protein